MIKNNLNKLKYNIVDEQQVKKEIRKVWKNSLPATFFAIKNREINKIKEYMDLRVLSIFFSFQVTNSQ